jgi:hypothetical protein
MGPIDVCAPHESDVSRKAGRAVVPRSREKADPIGSTTRTIGREKPFAICYLLFAILRA